MTPKEIDKVRIYIRDNYDLALWEVSDNDWLEIVSKLLK